MRLVLSTLLVAAVFAACSDDNESIPSRTEEVPAGSATPSGPQEELLYVRADQSAWLYDTLTRDQRQIVASGVCERWASAEWNSGGTKLAMMCGTSAENDAFSTYIFAADGAELDHLPGFRLHIWAPTSNRLLLIDDMVDEQGVNHDDLVIYNADAVADDPGEFTRIPDASGGSFSPDGTLLAYHRDADAPCAPGCKTGLVISNLAVSAERAYGDFVPLVWLFGGDALVVQSAQVRTDTTGYDGFIMKVETGEPTEAPALNGFTQCWAKPDGTAVVFLSREAELGLAVLDATTLEVTPIAGSTISYPSDHIPDRHVAPADDFIYWFDATGQGSPWFRANYDGTGLTQLGEASSFFLGFSPSRNFVAYPTSEPAEVESKFVVARIDGTQTVELGSSGFAFAWRSISR